MTSPFNFRCQGKYLEVVSGRLLRTSLDIDQSKEKFTVLNKSEDFLRAIFGMLEDYHLLQFVIICYLLMSCWLNRDDT